MKVRKLLAGALVAVCAAVTALAPPASADSATYVSGGTVVTRVAGQPVVDQGFVVCNDGANAGIGGFCVGFGGGDSVHVLDQVAGENVAFQACIDNNGDGLCTTPDFGACADVTFFSHDDDGSFKNPVGPMPTGFAPGCSGGFPGYVVFLCEGAHATGIDPHTHTAGAGTGSVTSGGEGSGSFCGGTAIAQSRKPYVSEHVAGGGPGFTGGCRGSFVDPPGGGDQDFLVGSVDALVVANNPTAAITVQCDLWVNGVFNSTVLTASGTGIAVNGTAFNRPGFATDVLTLCTVVTIGGPPSTSCRNVVVVPVPPQEVQDLLNAAVDTVDGVVKQLDPAICAFLAALAPGVPGVADITPDGDVYVNGQPVYDCPPYN